MLRQAQHERFLQAISVISPFALSLSKGDVVARTLGESVLLEVITKRTLTA